MISISKCHHFIAYSKWILAGEHSILRGGTALVFPHKSCKIAAQFERLDQELEVQFAGPRGEELQIVFWGVFEKALQLTGKTRKQIRGRLSLFSNIAMGTGLGASATLCVTLGRWWAILGWIQESDIYAFSRKLENIFHGESSGVDIAGAMSTEGVRFVKGGSITPIKIKWKPQWFLSDSGQRSLTSECVLKVKSLCRNHPEHSLKIDENMHRAVELSAQALVMDEKMGLSLLKEAIYMAQDCFRQWNLIEGTLEKHMQELLHHGALAVKPTGSGGGGYVLSLWNIPLPEALRPSLLII